jgi:hypothetical protein
VKSRSRSEGAEDEYVSIPNDNFDKAKAACAAFGCVPYFAIVVDAGNVIQGFIVPMKRLLTIFPKRKNGSGWKMTDRYLKQYKTMPDIKTFEFRPKTTKWWSGSNKA